MSPHTYITTNGYRSHAPKLPALALAASFSNSPKPSNMPIKVIITEVAALANCWSFFMLMTVPKTGKPSPCPSTKAKPEINHTRLSLSLSLCVCVCVCVC